MSRDLPPPPGGRRRRAPGPPQPMPPRTPPPHTPSPHTPSAPRHARAAPPEPPPVRRPPARRPQAPDQGIELFQDRMQPPRARRPRQIPPDESPTEFIEPVDDGYYEEDDFEGFEDYDDDYEDGYADDDRAGPAYIDPPDDEEPPAPVKRRRKRRKPLRWLVALTVLGLIAGGAWVGISVIFGYDDYPGNGDSDVVIEIGQGDSTNAIATELKNAGVVASPKAFVKASEDNSKVLSLQPGYYVVKTRMSGTAAVSKLTAPDARVGMLQVRAGTQLDDVTQPDGTVTPGVFTLLSKASCATLNGQNTCVPVDDLRKLAGTADVAAMGVPAWAADAVAKGTDPRRIEGLIAPGVYDVKPGWKADELLSYVLKSSATKIQAAGLGATTNAQGQDPYHLLAIASLIEREGVNSDFEKISRVIYNRLGRSMRLQLDSTVNYLLDKPVVTTTDADRARPDPYNTYVNNGLPPTPIGVPSAAAIQAALQPATGDWLFFVKCEKNGLSCFAATPAEHQQNIALARQRGAY